MVLTILAFMKNAKNVIIRNFEVLNFFDNKIFMGLLSNIVMKFSKMSKIKPRCHSVGNLPTLKVLCGKNVQCLETYSSINVLGYGLCRQVSFRMT